MTLERLTNERWGFESNCFVCESRNEDGLRFAFYHDTEADLVVAQPAFTAAHSGAPSLVHGGVQLAVLDEIMAWAAIAIGGRFAVTSELSASFARPVRVGREYRVEASIDEADVNVLSASARIIDSKARVCSSATATLVVLSEARAADVGVTVDDASRGFVRE